MKTQKRIPFNPNLGWRHTAMEAVCDLLFSQKVCQTKFFPEKERDWERPLGTRQWPSGGISVLAKLFLNSSPCKINGSGICRPKEFGRRDGLDACHRSFFRKNLAGDKLGMNGLVEQGLPQ